jgi:hypothetical protein
VPGIAEPPEELLGQVFPWLERERDALNERRLSKGRNGQDAALTKFLELLLVLRRIILQDAAVLAAKYPTCPLFKHPPFNSPIFRAFSSAAPLIIQRAEDEAQGALSSLPETMAASFRGILATNMMRHEQTRIDVQENSAELSRRLGGVEAMIRDRLVADSSSKPNKRRKRYHTLPPSTSTSHETQPDTATSETPQQTSDFTSIGSVLCSPLRSSSPVQPSIETSATVLPTSRVSLPPLQPATQLSYPHTTFPLASEPTTRQKQLDAITSLEKKFNPERLRQHTFEWRVSTSKRLSDEWLPVYHYPSSSEISIEDVWNEHMFGLDGHLSTSHLTAEWGARWRRNDPAAKTEAARRKKLILLIDTLSKKPNWNSERALRYLKAEYPIPTPSTPHLKTTRAFMEALQKGKGEFFQTVVEQANQYFS